jgi:hypothetical protein
MIRFLNSQSLGSICVGIAAISFGLAFIWARIRRNVHRYAAAIIAPLVLAYVVYWAPVWFGAGDRDQYAAWALLCIVAWFMTGAVTSLVTVFLIRRYGQRHSSLVMANQSTDPTP